MSSLTVQAGVTAKQVQELLTVFRDKFPRDPNSTLASKLQLMDRIAARAQSILESISRFEPGSAADPVVAARKQVDAMIWTIALAALATGAGWAIFWWGGYYLVKRRHLGAPAAVVGAEARPRDETKRPPPGKAA